MATATATKARRAPVVARPSPPRRPPLRIVERSRPQRTANRRRTLLMAIGLVVASMLIVALSQAYLTAGQVRLARIQEQLTAQQSQYRDLEMRVATLGSPSNVVGQAEQQGLTVPAQVTDLPLVSPSPTAGSGGK